MEFIELLKIAAPLLAVGGAWGGAKVALNGTRERVKDVAARLETHIKDESVSDVILHERVASIEVKQDMVIDLLRSTQ